MKDECFNIIFRKKIYTSVDELQADTDLWVKEYNQVRPHSGKHCYGKTPMQTFLDSLHIAKSKNLSIMQPEQSDNLGQQHTVR